MDLTSEATQNRARRDRLICLSCSLSLCSLSLCSCGGGGFLRCCLFFSLRRGRSFGCRGRFCSLLVCNGLCRSSLLFQALCLCNLPSLFRGLSSLCSGLGGSLGSDSFFSFLLRGSGGSSFCFGCFLGCSL
jgi:hypothetical protein